MPTIRLPLIGANSQRNPDAYNNTSKDCRYVNCVVKTAPNPTTRKNEFFLEKRIGLEAVSTVDGTNNGCATLVSGGIRYSTFQTASASRVFSGTTLIGTADIAVGLLPLNVGLTQISEVSLAGTRFLFFSHSRQETNPAGTGIYYFDTTLTIGTTTFTGDLNSSTSITNISSAANLRVGQRVTHANIPAGTRITVINGTTLTISAAATATAATQTITQEHLSKIMSANMPTKTTGKVFAMNGRVFFLDTVNYRIYQTAFNDPQTVNSQDYISLDYMADLAVGIQQNGMTAYGFGQNSIEIFNYAGNASGSQLTRAGVVDNGCPLISFSPNCVLNGVLYFVSFNGGIYRMSESSPQKISTPAIDAILASAASQSSSNSGVYIDGFYYDGRPFISVVSATNLGATPTVTSTFWYDIELNVWTEQKFTVSSTDRPVRLNSVGELRQTGAILCAALGKTYKLDFASPVYQDDSSTMTMTMQLGNSDLGTGKRKFFKRAWLVGDTQSDGTVTLEYSDDDYASWVTAGTFDLTNLGISINRLGSSRKRAWRLTDANNQAGRYQALDIEYEVGTS